jgi:hypothetical protein
VLYVGHPRLQSCALLCCQHLRFEVGVPSLMTAADHLQNLINACLQCHDLVVTALHEQIMWRQHIDNEEPCGPCSRRICRTMLPRQ